MLFSSIPFLYCFLPCVLILYFLSPRQLKNSVLLTASLVFYGWGEPVYLLLMLASVAVGYVCGLLTDKASSKKGKKVAAVSGAVITLSFLLYFKYTDFFIENFNAVTGLSVSLLKISLPIGISFYTFQILSYLIDVYKGTVPPQKNITDFASYVTMFPQLIAGPIVRYSDINSQLKSRTVSFEKFSLGIRKFIIGLSKKILIANTLGELCDIFRASDEKSVLFYWLYAVGYCLHVYFDFSGYSDMAIGLGRMLGFSFTENFNYPFISSSITEFWRRWHISLGTWFRDYVYIPMGGNKVGKARHFLNILTVWMLTGLWHGASWNFVIWGLYFAVLLIIEKVFLLKILRKSKVFSRIFVLTLIVISFVIFNAPDMTVAFSDIASLFGFTSIPLCSAETLYYLRSFAVFFIIGITCSTPLPKLLFNSIEKHSVGKRILNFAEPAVTVLLLVLITAYLVDGSYNPFLYFRF